MRSQFIYVLDRIGALGVQSHNQIIHPSLSSTLLDCKDKLGLGFKDLLFTDEPPSHLVSALRIAAAQVSNGRRKMLRVREVVVPFLDPLADPNTPRAWQRQLYDELQTALDNVWGAS